MDNKCYYTLILPEMKDITLQMLEDFPTLKSLFHDRQATSSVSDNSINEELAKISRKYPSLLFKVEEAEYFEGRFATYMIFYKDGREGGVPLKEPDAPEWFKA